MNSFSRIGTQVSKFQLNHFNRWDKEYFFSKKHNVDQTGGFIGILVPEDIYSFRL